MNPVSYYVTALAATVRARLKEARRQPERGDMPDQIVWISLLILIAVAAVAVISAKIMSRANGLDM
jgi:hypothetical protein